MRSGRGISRKRNADASGEFRKSPKQKSISVSDTVNLDTEIERQEILQ